MKYMRDNLEDTWGILALQEKILEIAVYIDEFCKKHNIDYCLMGGSALGAKRHGGFIPWDDDLDIFMTPENYEKFRENFLLNGDEEKYYLQEWGAVDGMLKFSKIRMNGTTYIEELLRDWDIHHGIYVDIFILHTCPNGKLKQINQCFWAKYVVMKGLAIKRYTKRGGFLGFTLKVMRFLPEKMLVKYGLKQVYRYRDRKTKYYCHFLGKAVFKNAIYEKEYFAKTKYIEFEKVKLKVPAKLHEFLTDRFGDYMETPTEDRIKWEQHAKSWDIALDFRESLKKYDMTFKDEKKLL